MQELITSESKYYDKSKEGACIQYWDTSNLYGWTMLQKLNIFEWIKKISQFDEDFIKKL